MADQHVSGFIYAVSGATLFSFKPVFIKLAYSHGIDSVTLLTLRMLMALPFYLVIGLWTYSRNRQQVISGKYNVIPTMLIGVLGYYLASYLDMLGLTMVTAQLERLILFTYPTIVVILSAILFKQPVTNNVWTALLLTYSGIASILMHDLSGLGVNVIQGAVLVIGSAICFALFMVLSKTQINKIGSRLFTTMAMSAASVAIISHFVVTRSYQQLLVSADLLLIVLGIAVMSTVIPSFLISAAINKIGPGQTSLIGSIGPVITALLAVSILGESFTSYHVIGMVLVIFGVSRLELKPVFKRANE